MNRIFEVGPIAVRPFRLEYFHNLIKSLFNGRSDLATYAVNGKPFTARSRGFLWLYKEFFLYKKHEFSSKTDRPVVLDVGSNTGVGIVAVKKQYPNSRIWAFEADPELAVILNGNLEKQDMLEGVVIESCAVWIEDGEISFNADGHGGGTLKACDNLESNVRVRAIDLNNWLKRFNEETIDLFKMDVEGAEFEILHHCKEHFERFSNVIIEFHVSRGEKSYLGEIISMFERAGLFVKFIDPNSWPSTPLRGCTNEEYRYESSFDIYFSRDVSE